MANFNSQLNSFTSPLANIGAAFQGSNLSGRDFIFNSGPSKETKRDDCIAALFLTNPYDDRQKHITFKGEVTGGTCTWIERDDVYKSWRDDPRTRSQLVWLSAPAGKGKTMLSIYATRQLEAWVRGGDNNTVLLYYFCDGRDEDRNTAICILRSLIHQLLTQVPAVTEIYLKTFAIHRDNLFQWSAIEPLWRLFETMVAKCGMGKVYCWIDGADECELSTLQHLLKKMKHFFSSEDASSTQLKVDGHERDEKAKTEFNRPVSLRMMIVSREFPPCLAEELSSFPRVSFSTGFDRNTSNDLHVYIKAKAEEILQVTGSSSHGAIITEQLEQRGDGTFLWVDVASARLKGTPLAHLETQLESLPSRLDDMLSQSLMNIPEEWTPYVQALLKWVLFAVRPLKIGELEVAVGLSTGVIITREELQIAIHLCGSVFNTRNEEVVLAHQVMRQFFVGPDATMNKNPRLQRFSISEAIAQSELANLCIAYLEGGALNIRKDMKKWRQLLPVDDSVHVARADGSKMTDFEINHLARNPLLNYAVLNWPHHARLGDVHHTNYDSPFFAPNSAARDIWWRSHWISTKSHLAWGSLAVTAFTPLHIAANFGIVPLAQDIENKGGLRDAMQKQDSYGFQPLLHAFSNADPAMCDFLLERGAATLLEGSKASFGVSVLEWAVWYGVPETVEYLLRRGHSPNAFLYQIESNTELAQAMWHTARYWKGSVNLVARQFRYSARDWWNRLERGYGATLLHLVGLLGHEAIAVILLAHGANPNSADASGWRPIHEAAFYGFPVIIDILVKSGAEIQVQTSKGYSPLYSAVHEGHIDAARKLINLGSSLKTVTNKGKTPLHAASKQGNVAMIHFLLEAGSDIEAVCHSGFTPLMYAAQAGQSASVEYLLAHGTKADRINTTFQPDIQHVTAMDLAKQSNNKETVMLLEAYSQDPDGFKQRYNAKRLGQTRPTESHAAQTSAISSLISPRITNSAEFPSTAVQSGQRIPRRPVPSRQSPTALPIRSNPISTENISTSLPPTQQHSPH